MPTLATPKSLLCIELGPQRPLALYELAYLIKKKMGHVLVKEAFVEPCVKHTTEHTLQPLLHCPYQRKSHC